MSQCAQCPSYAPSCPQDDEHIVLEPGDLFPPFSPPPSPRGEVKKGPQSPQQHRLFRVLETPVINNIRYGGPFTLFSFFTGVGAKMEALPLE